MTTDFTLTEVPFACGFFACASMTGCRLAASWSSAAFAAVGLRASKNVCQLLVMVAFAAVSLNAAGDGELLLEPELPPLLLLHAASRPAPNAPAASTVASRPVMFMARAIQFRPFVEDPFEHRIAARGEQAFRETSRLSCLLEREQVGEPRAVFLGATEETLRGVHPPDIKVQIVLPGVADTAMELDAVLGDVPRRVAGCGLRDRGGARRVRVSGVKAHRGPVRR